MFALVLLTDNLIERKRTMATALPESKGRVTCTTMTTPGIINVGGDGKSHAFAASATKLLSGFLTALDGETDGTLRYTTLI